MERLSDRAIEIINELHTERLDYESEYLPLIDCANKCSAYEDTGLDPQEVQSQKELFDYLIFDSAPSEDVERFKRLRELAQADREGRCVVMDNSTVEDLRKTLTLLDYEPHDDGVETYTRGFRNGYKNGKIEVLRHVLGTRSREIKIVADNPSD